MKKVNEDVDIEPQNPEESENVSQSVKSRKAFSKLRKELTDDELNAPGVQKLLLNEIERLEKECLELNEFRDKYFTTDKIKCVLSEKFKTLVWSEVLYSISLSIGSLLIAISFSIEKYSTFVFLSGISLLLISIIARIFKKWI